jgi:hypothetical protein
MERKSLPYIAHVLRHAFGDPRGTPTGCIRLLYGTFLRFRDALKGRVIPHYTDVLVLLMTFISAPRSRKEILELERIMALPCRCSSGPPVLRDAPASFHDVDHSKWIHKEEHLVSLIQAIMGTLKDCTDAIPVDFAYNFHRMDKYAMRARRRGEKMPFPRSPSDLHPNGSTESIQGIVAWPGGFSNRKISATLIGKGIPGLLSAMITTCASQVVPGLLTGWPFVAAIFHWLNEQNRGYISGRQAVPQYLEGITECIEFLGGLYSAMSPDELLFAFTMIRLDDLSFMLIVCDTMLRILDVQDENWKRINLPQIYTDKIERLKICVSNIASTVAFAADEYERSPEKYHPSLHQELQIALNTLHQQSSQWNKHLIKKWRERQSSFHQSYTSAFATLYGFTHNQRCAFPKCTQTWTNLMRRFKCCSGCKHVAYCSVECQRLAWRHPTSPHRSICGTIRHALDSLGLDSQHFVKHMASTVTAEDMHPVVSYEEACAIAYHARLLNQDRLSYACEQSKVNSICFLFLTYCILSRR